ALPPAKKRCNSLHAIFEVSRLILARNISPGLVFISAIYFPCDRFPGAQRYQAMFAERQAVRCRPAFLAQRDLAGIARQTIKICAIKTGKSLQLVQRAELLEGFGV